MRFYDPDSLQRIDSEERFAGLPGWEAARLCLGAGLVPSVTTILAVVHEPHITRWQVKTATNLVLEGMELDEALRWEDPTASEFGTRGHAVVEGYLKTGKEPAGDPVVSRHTAPALRWIDENVSACLASELSFASREAGYAGTVDLVLHMKDGTGLVADLKFKKDSERFPMKPGVGYRYQLAAYRRAMEDRFGRPFRIANLLLASPFGYRREPRLEVFWHEPDPWEGFEAVRRIWRDMVDAG